MRAIQMKEFGGPEVLELVDLPVPEPASDEVLVRVTRAGLNFADTHTRTNDYIAKAMLPLTPGAEVAGTLADTGERVVALVGAGGYAEYATAKRAQTFPIPDDLDDDTALALLLQGATAWHLYRTQGHVQPGETVVVHSAAGGVGSLAVQLGHPLAGAGRVIATASTQDKCALARDLGADEAVLSDADGLGERLIAANDGQPVDVVFEAIGGAIFDESRAALAPLGRIVVYGISTKEQNELRTGQLLKRSHAVIGFWLMHLLGRPGMLEEAVADLYARAARGELRVVVGGTYPLAQAAQAQQDLLSRRTTGKLLLDPTA
jgi:NADPH2:quinone reductase